MVEISPATIDRHLAGDRAGMTVRGRSHTKPGSLLKDAIPIRTWAQWDVATPGFVEIALVGHEGGNALGDHAYTLNGDRYRHRLDGEPFGTQQGAGVSDGLCKAGAPILRPTGLGREH